MVLEFDTLGQGYKTTFTLHSTNVWNKVWFHCKSWKCRGSSNEWIMWAVNSADFGGETTFFLRHSVDICSSCSPQDTACSVLVSPRRLRAGLWPGPLTSVRQLQLQQPYISIFASPCCWSTLHTLVLRFFPFSSQGSCKIFHRRKIFIYQSQKPTLL